MLPGIHEISKKNCFLTICSNILQFYLCNFGRHQCTANDTKIQHNSKQWSNMIDQKQMRGPMRESDGGVC